MLFKDSDTLRKYAALSGTINFEQATPTLKIVHEKHIKTVLGADLFKRLDDAFAAATAQSPLSNTLALLLEQCRLVIGPLFCVYYADIADIHLSDAGAQRVETQTNKTAYQYQVTKFKDTNLRIADECTELLLQFLEDNNTDYTEWAYSDQFKEYRKLFIKTGGEFNSLFVSHTPYRNYFAMRAKMWDVEQQQVRPFLGDTLFTLLKSKDQEAAPSFTNKQKELLQYLKPAIANYTVAFALPLLNVRMGANGLTVVSMTSFSQNEELNNRAGAASNFIAALKESCLSSAQNWMQQAKTFITNNPNDFTNWAGFATTETSSTVYQTKSSYGLI